MTIQSSTLDKLSVLETLYRRGYQSSVIDRTLDKLVDLERDRTQHELVELGARLKQFEAEYQMSSEDFYRRYEAGELGDSADFMEWSSFYDMSQSVKQRLSWITGRLN